ncbi:hypothetical protein [Cohnella cholangitidis]|uniref:Uncharacterized protein n=1 Tax=Cohnella cholangitidis TaxID=2598458 RepID=A0A7G5C443_9BACL|nr:hypothetical protein [Cohnella cholangitidis]QMV43977.1 hypothetical protein FPL14_24485 [Cohnella cholangitidis]
MKRLSKVTALVVGIFSMLISLAAFASAATTTGLQDGIYSTSSQPDARKSVYKMTVSVSDGKVSTVEFGQYNGTTKLQASFAEHVPEDYRETFKSIVAEVEDYQKQLNSTLDGAKVAKSADAVDGVYEAFQQLWESVVKDAGGTIQADAVEVSADQSPSVSNNPKTGDNSMMMYWVATGVALIAMIVLVRKMKTA